jgi:hypothetical protein
VAQACPIEVELKLVPVFRPLLTSQPEEGADRYGRDRAANVGSGDPLEVRSAKGLASEVGRSKDLSRDRERSLRRWVGEPGRSLGRDV